MDCGSDPKFLWLVGSCFAVFLLAWGIYGGTTGFSDMQPDREERTWIKVVVNWLGSLALLGLWLAMIGVFLGDPIAMLAVLGCAFASYLAKTTEGFCKGLF
jgi:hypothetical protein